MAAGALIAHPDFPANVPPLVDQSGYWREVIKWVVGIVTHCDNRPRDVMDIVEGVCPGDAQGDPLRWHKGWLAGECILEMGRTKADKLPKGPKLIAHVVAELEALIAAGALPARDRAAAGMVLGQLGDLREGVGCVEGVPFFKWSAEFPAGDFTLGEGEKKRRILAPFRMSIYPVTVQQFAAFLREGYGDDQYWTSEDRKHREAGPTDYEQAEFQTPNHPRVGISWYEAAAFCKWVSAQTKNAIRLPTEAEWERAAAGDGRKFAWGDAKDDELPAHCNMDGTGIGHTSAVGIFPTGNTPEGIADMTGNVWEWCASRSNDDSNDASKPVAEIKSDQPGVGRGGSWGLNGPDALRASCRYNFRPGDRSSYIGFRVVVVGAAC